MTTAPFYCEWKPSQRQPRGVECRRCGRYLYEAQKVLCREPGGEAMAEPVTATAHPVEAIIAKAGAEMREQPQQELPPLPQRALRYFKAVGKWVWEGQPTRSEDDIERLLAICTECEHWIPSKGEDHAGACAKCGCCGSAQQSGWQNKLAMATEDCPEGKWI